MQETRNIEGHNITIYKYASIYVIEDVFDDLFCKKIIDIIDITVKDNKLIYSNGNNVLCYTKNLEDLINTNDTLCYRFSTEPIEYKFLSNINSKTHDSMYTNINNGIMKKELVSIEECLVGKIKNITNIMKILNEKVKMENSAQLQLRKIYGTTRLHTDGIVTGSGSSISYIKNNKYVIDEDCRVRTMSMVCAFNDEYEGGYFNFPNHDINLRLKKGAVILFPPFWTHPHEVTALENETYRYTMNTWFCDKL